MNLLVLFILLSVLNVILQTIKSAVTIKGVSFVIAGINALAYSIYASYTNCELPLIMIALICGITNFIGIWIVKLMEKNMKRQTLKS